MEAKLGRICDPVPVAAAMEISLLKELLNNITLFFHLSSCNNTDYEPVQKLFQRIEDMLKLLKPVLEAIVDSQVTSNEVFIKAFEELGQSVDDLRELFENMQPLKSKVYFVLLVESLISKVQTCGLEVFQLLQSKPFDQCLPEELSSTSLEHCIQKMKHMVHEERQISAVIKESIREVVEGSEPPASDSLAKIEGTLCLRSNQELLIEVVALEKLKENAEQAENNGEAEYIERMIALITHMHERFLMTKQSQSSDPVVIPPDFCCPLSLELMTDPVIVSSGQTYERAFIKKWIDLGLTVCPKTRQTLANTNLIPNYNVKALIASWCELNNVKLPNPTSSMILNPPSPHVVNHVESYVPHSRNTTQPLLPESNPPTGSPGNNHLVFPSSRNGPSPSHPRSSAEGGLSSVGVAMNGHGLDIGGRTSTMSPEERSLDSDSQSSESPSPSRKKFASTAVDDERFSESNDNRIASASEASQGPTHLTSSDATTERAAAATPQREADFPSRLGSRNQTIWPRPSERFVPRIVSSPANETRADLHGIESQVRRLIAELRSTDIDVQRDATEEIRLLAKHNMDNRIVIANCGAIPLLVDLLHSPDIGVQENAVTALLNLSINDNNKTAIANADAIEPLIHVLNTGSPVAKENSAATLFSLSVIEDNKVKIGRSSAIKPLVELLGSGTPRGKKDAATALFNLSIFHENKARIVQAGAVRHLVDLMDPAAGMVDKAVAVLANLATIPEGRTAIGEAEGIPVLVEVVELGSARGKENAAAALLLLCTNSSKFCTLVLQEGAVPPLVALSQSGTPRAKEKAQQLLSYFRNQRHGSSGRG